MANEASICRVRLAGGGVLGEWDVDAESFLSLIIPLRRGVRIVVPGIGWANLGVVLAHPVLRGLFNAEVYSRLLLERLVQVAFEACFVVAGSRRCHGLCLLHRRLGRLVGVCAS